MPNWKKVILSGSNAHVYNLTASGNFRAVNDALNPDSTPPSLSADGDGVRIFKNLIVGDPLGEQSYLPRNIRVKSGDNGDLSSSIEIHGDSSGRSHLFVGRSINVGGGISYAGSSPYLNNQTENRLEFFRRPSIGNEDVVFSYGKDNNDVEFKGNITASNDISASGLLYASLSFDSPSTPATNGVVVYDSSSGRFYQTGSYSSAEGLVSVAGNNTEIQFNDNGSFGASSDFTFDGFDVSIPRYVSHSGDDGSYFGFNANNNFRVTLGGNTNYQANSTLNEFNPGNENIDFSINGTGELDLFYVNADTKKISMGGIGTNPSNLLELQAISGATNIEIKPIVDAGADENYCLFGGATTSTYIQYKNLNKGTFTIGVSNNENGNGITPSTTYGGSNVNHHIGHFASPTDDYAITLIKSQPTKGIYGMNNISGNTRDHVLALGLKEAEATGQVYNLQHWVRFFTTTPNGAQTTQVGSLRRNGDPSSVILDSTSDKRLKTNIQDLDIGLETLLKIKPRSFNWKSNPNNEPSHGFIAQELNRIYPKAVKRPSKPNSDPHKDPWSLAEASLIQILVKSIQDQQKIIKKLETRIKKLENNA